MNYATAFNQSLETILFVNLFWAIGSFFIFIILISFKRRLIGKLNSLIEFYTKTSDNERFAHLIFWVSLIMFVYTQIICSLDKVYTVMLVMI